MLGHTFKKKAKKTVEAQNLLSMVPVLTDRISSVQKDEGRVTLILPRKSWLERQSVKWLKQPEDIRIHLDDLGSAVVSRCRGHLSVAQIADELHLQFGEKAEPLLPRLAKFLEVLEANALLAWQPSAADQNGKSAVNI